MLNEILSAAAISFILIILGLFLGFFLLKIQSE
uniref:Cytochrome b6-f complex subunit 7 n=1 Tax=Caloglossa beccarii TaxID=131038 RepID=A0A1Z1M963_9FLOR|nr:cytochrome b6-f complex subunit 7 [Caloglossa beccarii]ARW62305.1 cytochrome b6-f complex subunit 7 [Caloglossa beccarii]